MQGVEMIEYGIALSNCITTAGLLYQVRKGEVKPGDWMFVKTCNSVYLLRLIGDDECLATGGWFDNKGLSPYRVKINGCTWGGSVINMGILAAQGLCIEFNNRVTTSQIQMIAIMPYWLAN